MENTAVQNYNFEGNDVRTLSMDGEPWFVGKDIASALEYKKTRNAIERHVDEEDKQTLTWRDCSETGRTKIWVGNDHSNKVIINESGMYSLIMGSKLESAKRFKRWVTSEVLPSIRKHGAYITDNTLDNLLSDPDTAIKLFTELKNERNARQLAESTIKEQQPKVSYYDAVLQSKSLMTVTQIAKDYGMSARALNSKLSELGIQFKQADQWFLYSKYQDLGYTQSKTYTNDKVTRLNTQWTQKGRLFLYEQLKKIDILPVVEQK